MAITIKIKKYLIRNLLFSFVIGFGLLYILEHFGEFKYIANSDTPTYDKNGMINFTVYHKPTDLIISIIYISFFNSEVKTEGNGYNVGDLAYSNSNFYTYPVKSYYYTKAALLDIKYAFYFSITIFAFTLIFTEFKIKFI
ncbi:hypothetical protein H4O20_05180 [Aequorivita sp. 609]|uniref:hypothetical protein n=1 Tax=Aequorivita TaxID=153265 RepID=UPI00161D586D|nr:MULTISPECIES: hypothetical protein [Aequorivita]MBB6680829.1 hypothetical protein [Aequorivita sp. 609]